MKTKRVQYMDLLKEAINNSGDPDKTADSVDIKGPFVDGILSYRGGGELPTHKDAAGILERYYFKDENDHKVVNIIGEDTPPAEANDIDEVPDENITKTKKDIEKAIVEEQGKTTKKATEDEEETETPEVDKDVSESEVIENAIVEKLIAEMEEEGDEGAGTKAAGTGKNEKDIPDRKDAGEGSGVTDKSDKKLKEQEEVKKDPPVDEEDEELDIDKELDKGAKEVEEAFNIFQEQIEEDSEIEDVVKEGAEVETEEIEDIDSDDLIV